MAKCRICGSSNLIADPAGYYDHARGLNDEPMACLNARDAHGYIRADHTTYACDLSPEGNAYLRNIPMRKVGTKEKVYAALAEAESALRGDSTK